jgi:hypothetical protein
VTDFSIKDEAEHLSKLFESLLKRDEVAIEAEEHKDNIFKQMYIPRSVQEYSIDDIYRMERQHTQIETLAKMANFESTQA